VSLKRRELALLCLGGFFVFMLVYYFLVISPALSKQTALERFNAKKSADLISVMEMRDQWKVFQKKRANAEEIFKRRGKDFSLLSYLEQISRETGIEASIQYMKPLTFSASNDGYKPEGIEMGLKGIHIQQLVHFLHKIEHSENLLFIKRFKVRPITDNKIRLLELTLQIQTYSSI